MRQKLPLHRLIQRSGLSLDLHGTHAHLPDHVHNRASSPSGRNRTVACLSSGGAARTDVSYLSSASSTETLLLLDYRGLISLRDTIAYSLILSAYLEVCLS